MRSFVLAAAASLIIAAPAAAATITVNHVLDPSLISGNIFQDNLATPFIAASGDTVIFNLTFTGGLPITVEGDSYMWLLSLTNSGNAVLRTVHIAQCQYGVRTHNFCAREQLCSPGQLDQLSRLSARQRSDLIFGHYADVDDRRRVRL
jgi:hypothetical protein